MSRKIKTLDADGDLDVSWYTTDDLINLAWDRKALAKMDSGDMANLIHELGSRLQRAVNELNNGNY